MLAPIGALACGGGADVGEATATEEVRGGALEDNETHAVFIDPFPGDNRETKSDEAGANELVLWEKRHKNDPRISFRRSTRGFRPWRRSMRRSFSRFVMARLMDEGFKSVCSPQPMEFAFLVRGIRRRLSFLAGDTAPMRYQTSAVCDSGVRVSTVVSIGVALDNDHPLKALDIELHAAIQLACTGKDGTTLLSKISSYPTEITKNSDKTCVITQIQFFNFSGLHLSSCSIIQLFNFPPVWDSPIYNFQFQIHNFKLKNEKW